MAQYCYGVTLCSILLLCRTLSLQSASLVYKDLLIAIQAIIICLSQRRIIYLHMLSLLLRSKSVQ